MSVLIAIIFLTLNLGTSGGAIRPVVTFTPNWGNILVGDPVTLSCDMTSTVPEEPRTYHWYKDNQPIPGDQQSLPKPFSSVGDSGDYQCRVSAGDISDPATLNVTINYLILQRPPSAIYEGDPLTLRCHHSKDFSGQPARFYKDDEEIKSQSFDEFHIHKVNLNTAGRYKCTKKIAREDQHYSEISAQLSVSVKELFSFPDVKVTPYWVREGSDMTVRCDTRLDPLRGVTELQFAFYRDGRTVQKFSVSDTYRVRSAQLEDSGTYTCEVRTVTDTVRKRSDGLYIQIYGVFTFEFPAGSAPLQHRRLRTWKTDASIGRRRREDTAGIEGRDCTLQNIIRLMISIWVLVAALCFIYFHNKW